MTLARYPLQATPERERNGLLLMGSSSSSAAGQGSSSAADQQPPHQQPPTSSAGRAQPTTSLAVGQFTHCGRTAELIHRKFSPQPGSGDPIIPPLVLQAKEIMEAINVKVGISNVDVSEFFDDDAYAEVEHEMEEQQMDAAEAEFQDVGVDAAELLDIGAQATVLEMCLPPWLHLWQAVRHIQNTTN